MTNKKCRDFVSRVNKNTRDNFQLKLVRAMDDEIKELPLYRFDVSENQNGGDYYYKSDDIAGIILNFSFIN